MKTADRTSNERIVESIAILTRQVANDLGGFGSYVDPVARSSTDIRGGLIIVCRELLRLRRKLIRMRKPYVGAQASRVALSGPTDRIQIGGGGQTLEGWLSVDLPPADLSVNVLWGLPIRGASARVVFCSHMLEHLDYPDAALAFLREVRRVLRPGGVLRLVVPDIQEYLAAYARRDRAFFRARRKIWPGSERCETMLTETLLYAGAASQPHDFFGHKFGYDFETLKLLLRKAGFRRIERSAYMKSRHPDLRVDSASPYARAAFRGRHYSLFVDAVR